MDQNKSTVESHELKDIDKIQPSNSTADFPITFIDGAGSLHIVNNIVRFGLLQDHVDPNGNFSRKIVASLAMTPETAEGIVKWLSVALNDLKLMTHRTSGGEV